MKINNLSQLKKTLQKGAKFKIINHWKPDMKGLTRVVNVVKTVGIYTTVENQSEHELSTCNGGKGNYMGYDKASHYLFGDTIKWFKNPIVESNNELIMEFELVS